MIEPRSAVRARRGIPERPRQPALRRDAQEPRGELEACVTLTIKPRRVAARSDVEDGTEQVLRPERGFLSRIYGCSSVAVRMGFSISGGYCIRTAFIHHFPASFRNGR